MQMLNLTEQILQEAEYRPASRADLQGKAPAPPCQDKVATAGRILEAAASHGRAVIAYSGGADSTALLHMAAETGLKPILIWCDTRMEYPETRAHVEAQAKAYGLPLAIARARREPQDQWRQTGWPMLGKMAARIWTVKHRNAGFALNVSECCREMKIKPARRLTRNLGCTVQITGQRGKTDDRIRGMRNALDGPVTWKARDRMWIANPLVGWTDDDIAGYTAQHNLAKHPAKARGAGTIGCVFCGGGSQFENSGYRVLRRTWPEAWRKFIVEWGGGHVILVLKYDVRLEQAQAAVRELGGLEHLAEERPWIFDFTRMTPLRGYTKGTCRGRN